MVAEHTQRSLVESGAGNSAEQLAFPLHSACGGGPRPQQGLGQASSRGPRTLQGLGQGSYPGLATHGAEAMLARLLQGLSAAEQEPAEVEFGTLAQTPYLLDALQDLAGKVTTSRTRATGAEPPRCTDQQSVTHQAAGESISTASVLMALQKLGLDTTDSTAFAAEPAPPQRVPTAATSAGAAQQHRPAHAAAVKPPADQAAAKKACSAAVRAALSELEGSSDSEDSDASEHTSDTDGAAADEQERARKQAQYQRRYGERLGCSLITQDLAEELGLDEAPMMVLKRRRRRGARAGKRARAQKKHQQPRPSEQQHEDGPKQLTPSEPQHGGGPKQHRSKLSQHEGGASEQLPQSADPKPSAPFSNKPSKPLTKGQLPPADEEAAWKLVQQLQELNNVTQLTGISGLGRQEMSAPAGPCGRQVAVQPGKNRGPTQRAAPGAADGGRHKPRPARWVPGRAQ